MNNTITFYLPLGLDIDGKLHKRGKIHLTTTLDELEVQQAEEVSMNSRYRDILLLTSVIDEIGEITNVTKETIMSLYEADFLYLQLLYKQINGDNSLISTKCPDCGQEFQFSLAELYSDEIECDNKG